MKDQNGAYDHALDRILKASLRADRAQLGLAPSTRPLICGRPSERPEFFAYLAIGLAALAGILLATIMPEHLGHAIATTGTAADHSRSNLALTNWTTLPLKSPRPKQRTDLCLPPMSDPTARRDSSGRTG